MLQVSEFLEKAQLFPDSVRNSSFADKPMRTLNSKGIRLDRQHLASL
jgi:hypothetical protein